jgi:hypothetical protein
MQRLSKTILLAGTVTLLTAGWGARETKPPPARQLRVETAAPESTREAVHDNVARVAMHAAFPKAEDTALTQKELLGLLLYIAAAQQQQQQNNKPSHL